MNEELEFVRCARVWVEPIETNMLDMKFIVDMHRSAYGVDERVAFSVPTPYLHSPLHPRLGNVPTR